MAKLYQLEFSNNFEKDLKLMKKRGQNMPKLFDILDLLEAGNPLPPKNKEHLLIGNYKGYLECHITPDWLLIYKRDEENKTIYLAGTGSHSDLF
jgi:mRNA interferase YafQ